MFTCIRCGEIVSTKGALKNHLNKKNTCDNIIVDINLYEYKNILSLPDKHYKNELLNILLKKMENIKNRQDTCNKVEELIIENKKLRDIIDQKNKIIKNTISDIEEKHEEYIYIIKEREFVISKENVYKLGMSKNVKNRMSDYPKGSQIKDITAVINAKKSEEDLLDIFKKMFLQRTDIGKEYFQGDLQCMRNEIHKYVYIEISSDL